MKTDLDALERVVREMTEGEWERLEAGGSIWPVDDDGNAIGECWIVEDAIGSVALRNAAESLIGKLRLARKVVQIAGYMRDYECCPDKTFPECREIEDAEMSCGLWPLFAALAAYQTATGEGKP